MFITHTESRKTIRVTREQIQTYKAFPRRELTIVLQPSFGTRHQRTGTGAGACPGPSFVQDLSGDCRPVFQVRASGNLGWRPQRSPASPGERGRLSRAGRGPWAVGRGSACGERRGARAQGGRSLDAAAVSFQLEEETASLQRRSPVFLKEMKADSEFSGLLSSRS